MPAPKRILLASAVLILVFLVALDGRSGWRAFGSRPQQGIRIPTYGEVG